MSAHARLRRSAAITLTAAITTGSALLLTACGPTDGGKSNAAGTTSAAPAAAAPAAASAPGATAGTPATEPVSGASVPSPAGTTPGAPQKVTGVTRTSLVNGTAHNGLTISNGTQYVLMNGTSVDFHTVVRDLAWSPDGKKAAFIDGSGNLVTANPDGSGRTVVAKNPGGQTWSHPTWQVAAGDPANYVPTKNNIFFAATAGGVARLESVPATGGTPQVLRLNSESGEGVQPLPQTGNIWPSAGGKYGTAVYANSTDGEVYIRDEYVRQQGSAVEKGSEPALSPDSQEIVFVRSANGHDHLFLTGHDGKPATDLTPHATTDFTEPAWSPDGRTIAARTPDGIYTVPVNGSSAPVRVSSYTGLPAYRG